MNVAFIPVRGGSKSIPLKNIKIIGGKPLVYWGICAACKCSLIDKVFVATDSNEIRETVLAIKKDEQFTNLYCIDRSEETATDKASTESVMLEFASKFDFDNIVLIQATSPLISENDLKKGFELLKEGADSVLSVVRQKRFRWKMNEHNEVYPDNYDYLNRPRRQEFEGYLVENGAFYITSKRLLLESNCRISGRIKAVEMDEESYYEIDEPTDFLIVDGLLKRRNQNRVELNDSLKKIKMFLTDCDGCLTDGGMYYSENGDEIKKFNARDGKGFELLHRAGILTGIITGEARNLNKARAEKLKVDVFEMGVQDKLTVLKRICKQYDISMDEIAYVGDDVNDISVLEHVGVPCCVNDAVNEVKNISAYVSKKRGGEGAVRDIIEYILKSREFE